MRVLATKQTTPAPTRQQRAPILAQGRSRPTASLSSDLPLLQRKCACGGGCPRCQATLQPRLTMSEPGDQYEQEADHVAEQVTGMPEPKLQRSSVGHGEPPPRQQVNQWSGRTHLQPQHAPSTVSKEAAIPSIVNKVMHQTGHPLDVSTRSFMEPRFGVDLSQVRIHADALAAKSAAALAARAYTVRNDIVFGTAQYKPGSRATQWLLAHELTHVIQQNASFSRAGHRLIQRSCFDGNCDECGGGFKDLWVTVFFARRANQATMQKLRTRINKAKAILANCCVRIKFDFNWTLIPGAASIETASRHRRPANDPLGLRDVPEPQETIGEGDLIASARGIPLLVVDEIRGTGGGTTILGGQTDRGQDYDVEYTGPSMFFMAVNQPREGACSAVDLTIAHELWHVTGALRHNAADGAITDCSGEGVAEPYCTAVRGLT